MGSGRGGGTGTKPRTHWRPGEAHTQRGSREPRGGAATGPQNQREEKPTGVSSKDSKGESDPVSKGRLASGGKQLNTNDRWR